ncbi:Gfo/Idh/MocA family protein [Propioniciclava soli]|uniref:Gfo/Idh/MocA family oxidoreductase n=1 Tax=Propioniciclava soli TaxID=2775081 RepID=A0ABZ3C706_9ACTN|nr:Gfo/Idh/MocA family oxidoreductase [Propioniciclava soli]
MTESLGIIVNGASGRMGYRQHLVRSLLPIRDEGGILLPDGTRVPIRLKLVGRNAAKISEVAERHGIDDWTTDLDEALADDDFQIYFDGLITQLRAENLRKAMKAGKAIYTEKPTAESFEDALALAREAKEAGVKAGVVHDKLYLPGLRKLKDLIDSGFFGDILSVRGEFGYWVFEGDWVPSQRPSWNYRTEDGGGIVTDMYPHWNYVIEELFGRIASVQTTIATHIPKRWDEQGEEYTATAEDAAYGLFVLENGVIVSLNSSWDVRVHRDELVEFQIDGTKGSAVVGLHKARIQPRELTPKPVWNPDIPDPINHRDFWLEVPEREVYDNGFKVQWEEFLRAVVLDEPYPYDLLSGARGVRLAEVGLQAAADGRRIDLEPLTEADL